MQQDDSLNTSNDDRSPSQTSWGHLENPKRGIVREVVAYDPRFLAYFDMLNRIDPKLSRLVGSRRRRTSRQANLTPSERKRLADGLRAWRREVYDRWREASQGPGLVRL